MKAINTNSAKQIRKAVACAPRNRRAQWLLNITVGTQSISPLFWAIESSNLDAARAMIIDLFVIRADRDTYYYGCDLNIAKLLMTTTATTTAATTTATTATTKTATTTTAKS